MVYENECLTCLVSERRFQSPTFPKYPVFLVGRAGRRQGNAILLFKVEMQLGIKQRDTLIWMLLATP